MSAQFVLQETTVGTLIAEGLEAEAARMPPSHSEQAEILRSQAARYRESETKVVKIMREVPPKFQTEVK